jgi:beta-galactosidase
VAGAGELAGVDNGNAADTLSLKGDEKALFSGKALAVVRSLRGQPGIATLSVSSPYATVKTNIVIK